MTSSVGFKTRLSPLHSLSIFNGLQALRMSAKAEVTCRPETRATRPEMELACKTENEMLSFFRPTFIPAFSICLLNVHVQIVVFLHIYLSVQPIHPCLVHQHSLQGLFHLHSHTFGSPGGYSTYRSIYRCPVYYSHRNELTSIIPQSQHATTATSF